MESDHFKLDLCQLPNVWLLSIEVHHTESVLGEESQTKPICSKVAPVIPSLNNFYLSGCKSHAGDTVQFWLVIFPWKTVCTCFYFIIIMMNKKNGYVLTVSGMLIYLHTQGALCDLLLLLSTNLNQMMGKKTFPFLARVFHHCLLVLRPRRKSCRGVAAEWLPAAN